MSAQARRGRSCRMFAGSLEGRPDYGGLTASARYGRLRRRWSGTSAAYSCGPWIPYPTARVRDRRVDSHPGVEEGFILDHDASEDRYGENEVYPANFQEPAKPMESHVDGVHGSPFRGYPSLQGAFDHVDGQRRLGPDHPVLRASAPAQGLGSSVHSLDD